MSTAAGKKGYPPPFPEQGHSFLDDAEPRPPPRIPRFPIPFNMEKPKMQVPDVSLIFNSSTDSNDYLNAPSISPNPIAVKQTYDNKSSKTIQLVGDSLQDDFLNTLNSEELKQEIRSLLPLVSSQGASIIKIEEKLDKILQFQDKFLSQLFQKGSAISKEVQTEDSICFKPASTNSKEVKKNSPEMTLTSSRNLHKNYSPSFPTRHVQVAQKPDGRQKGPLGRVKCTDKTDDDLSAILKDLQLPNMNEPSVFSDTSGIKSLELLEFNDDSFRSGSGVDSPTLGASASTFGSNSSSDEESEDAGIKPTATFYNNVLGNVNRLLEGGSKNKEFTKSRENVPSASKPMALYKQGNGGRRAAGLESSGVSGNSSSSSSSDSVKTPISKDEPGDEVVEATKRYLEKLGVQFGSPSSSEKKMNVGNNSKNYMIQQNVYNSIYIPTVNCPPVMPEAYSNAESGNFHSLAQKYVPAQELQQFDELKAQNEGIHRGTSDTTVYGMSPNNLSFATKQYLQRYGLVHEQGNKIVGQKLPVHPQSNKFFDKMDPRSDRILDITAIKNQPKLL